jgi:hypothetical protein
MLVKSPSCRSLLLLSAGSSRISIPGPTGLAFRDAGKTYEAKASATSEDR